MGSPLKNDWESISQPFELHYWKVKGIKDYSDEEFFKKWWKDIFDWVGEIKGEVLDIGSGVRPPLKRGYVIEPLGLEYKKIAKPEWWSDIKLYSQPAENFIPELENKIDFILCWNSIDHGYDWIKVVDNIWKYLRNGGIVALATDCKIERLGDHPILGVSKEQFLEIIMERFNIIKRSDDFAERDIAILLKK
jgi:SAM-dependent methyltransferase